MNEWNSHGNMLVKRCEKPVNYTKENMKSQQGFSSWNPGTHRRATKGFLEGLQNFSEKKIIVILNITFY